MDLASDPPICRIDVALLEDYAAATEAYFDAVKRLEGALGSDMVIACELAQLARKDCVSARELIVRHRAVHGCRKIAIPAESNVTASANVH